MAVSAPTKIVPKSKLSEWRGLDGISAVVHGMGCIFREQEKDDIGIDGEIELCISRTDGDGRIGTGQIVKVQSKSGISYIAADSDDSFTSPVRETDLRYWNSLNLPIIYIVYHPKDKMLYWKDIKSYISSTPDVFTPPLRIDFDKENDRFDEKAYDALLSLCRVAPERVSTDVGETIYTNLLRFVQLPGKVWVTPVLPEKQPGFHRRLSGIIPPYSYRSGILTTLTDPTVTDTALTSVVDQGGVEDHDLDDWLSLDANNTFVIRELLRDLVHQHLLSIGLTFQEHPRRYFYGGASPVVYPIRRHWTNSRTGKSQSRQVAAFHEYGKISFYRHEAFDFRIEELDDAWVLSLDPILHFSTDGIAPWKGKKANSFLIRARAKQYNDILLRNVLFWSNQISSGQASVDLSVDGFIVATLSGIPLSAEATFSIRTATSNKQRQGAS